MAEYIEREALREILDRWRDAHADVDDIHGCGLLEDVICEVDAQTAADVAPVVRCKDCTHLYGTLCTACGLLPRKPDDFCSRGERKDGADHEAD